MACISALLVTSFASALSANMFDAFAIQGGIQGGLGYRQDSIIWKIHDLERVNPTASSNVHFKDLEIILLEAKFRGLIGSTFYTRASLDYGWVIDGTVREELTVNHRHECAHFDHNGVLTEGRFNRAVLHNKQKHNSYVWDIDIGFGIPFEWCCEGFKIAPMIGFAYDSQQIKTHNKERILANRSTHFPQILSGESIKHKTKSSHTFRAAWWGPWIGFDFCYAIDCWNLFGEFELQFGRVERKRSSKVGVPYFDNYSRTKDFWGTTTRLGANYTLSENWYLEATLSYTHLASNVHRDSIYFSSGTARLDAGYRF